MRLRSVLTVTALLGFLLLVGACKEDGQAEPTATVTMEARATNTPTPSSTPTPTNTPLPPEPTDTPLPPPPLPPPPTVTPIPPGSALPEIWCHPIPLTGVIDTQSVSIIDECVTVTGTAVWITEQVRTFPPSRPGFQSRSMTYTYAQIAADDGSSIVAVMPFGERLGFGSFPDQWPVHAGDHVVATGTLTFDSSVGATQLYPCWQFERWP